MTYPMNGRGTTGILAWVSERDWSAHGPLVETAARFDLEVRFCRQGEAASQLLRDERCLLVVVEVESSGALGLLKEIRERARRIAVFAASEDADVETMRAALEAGATEVLSLPLDPQELSKALLKLTHLQHAATTSGAAQLGEIFTVYGARGGIGTTTLAVNVAVRIGAMSGKDTALVDLDLQRGDVAAFLNLTPMQSIATIAEARSEVDEIFLHGTMTRHPSGVHVLPAPAQIEEADVVTQEDVLRAFEVLRPQFRYTIVDTPRTITSTTLAALEISDRVLVLADLSVPGVRAAQRAVQLFGRLGLPPQTVALLLVETPGRVQVKDAVQAIGKEPLMIIPRDDAAAREAMNAGTPLNGARPSRLTLSVAELARKLVGAGNAPTPKRRLLHRLFTREASR
jgi:pilus assembly protein CpaE